MDALFMDKLWTPDLYFYNTRADKIFVLTIFYNAKDPENPLKSTRRGLWLEKKKEGTEVHTGWFLSVCSVSAVRAVCSVCPVSPRGCFLIF